MSRIPSASKVYVGNLDNSVSEQDLHEVFGKAGHIIKLWVARNPPGFAFVEYEDPREAEEACKTLNGVNVRGRSARVELSNKRDRDNRSTPNSSGPLGGGGGGMMIGRDNERRRSRERSPLRRRSPSRRSRSPRRHDERALHGERDVRDRSDRDVRDFRDMRDVRDGPRAQPGEERFHINERERAPPKREEPVNDFGDLDRD